MKEGGTMDTTNITIEEARAALDRARADHARALLAATEAPSDPEAARRMRAAVRVGRGAWKGYQAAATAGLAAEIENIVPGAFRESGPGGDQ